MNHSHFLVPLSGALCLALSLAPGAARAQDFRSMRQSFQTSGTLSWAGQSQNVRRVRIELEEDGAARLKFDDQERGWNWGWRDGDWKDWSQNLELSGIWVREGRGISVDLRRGFNGQNIIGTARIALDDGFGRPRPSEIAITGRIVRHPWDTLDLSGRFTFGAWNGGTGGNTGNRLDELSTIKRGTGQFTDNGIAQDISRANVELSRDGTAKVTLSGEREYGFEGRWRQTSAGRIELRLDTFSSQSARQPYDAPRGQADADSLGGGEIRLDGTKITSIRLSGTRSNRDFDARFEPQTDTWNGNNGGGNWNGNNGNGGGWNGGGNGGWNGNNGNGGWNRPAPNPQPETGWNGWGGAANGANKGTLPAPEPQERPRPRVEKPRRPEVEAPPATEPKPIEASWRGEAVLQRAGGDEAISSASLVIEPSRRGTLQIGDHKVSGSWRQDGPNAYRLRSIKSGSLCVVEVTLRGDQIETLKISGILDGAKTTLSIGN